MCFRMTVIVSYFSLVTYSLGPLRPTFKISAYLGALLFFSLFA